MRASRFAQNDRVLTGESLAIWWDSLGRGVADYNSSKVMRPVSIFEPQLLAVWAIRFNIVWWRLILALSLIAGMLTAAWALDNPTTKKKK